MKRRTFLGVVAGAAAWPATARSQSLPVIGFLNTANPNSFAPFVTAYRKGLSDSGFAEGNNVTIVWKWADNRIDRLPAMAQELVDLKVSVIAATGGLPSALAAKKATATIPIVFTAAGDPVRNGLVSSLNRPSGNITGAAFVAVALIPKRVELLRDLLPGASRLAFISAGLDPEEDRLAETSARALGFEIETLKVSSDQDFNVAFQKIAGRRIHAALIGTSATFLSRRSQIVQLAARYSIPAIYPRGEYVEEGGLISYSPPVTEAYRQAGIYTARILNGTKPGDLPVIQPTKFELAINLKTAKALNISVPPTMLARADEVVE